MLMDMGATKDDCIAIIKIAFDTVEKIANERG